jgi:hypothetical protein
MFGEHERTFVLVTKEGPGLAAPVAAHDVRIPERGVGPEISGRSFLLASDEVVAAENSARGFSNGLPARHT